MPRAAAQDPRRARQFCGVVDRKLRRIVSSEPTAVVAPETHLRIGSLLFEGLDQIDLTGPFEVLSRIPDSTYRLHGPTAATVRDVRGLRLAPDAAMADAPPLDVLHVPGGVGQEALMEPGCATTHRASFHLLPFFGAIAVDERVVVDGRRVFAAGVTAGIDGALRLAAEATIPGRAPGTCAGRRLAEA